MKRIGKLNHKPIILTSNEDEVKVGLYLAINYKEKDWCKLKERKAPGQPLVEYAETFSVGDKHKLIGEFDGLPIYTGDWDTLKPNDCSINKGVIYRNYSY